MNCCYCQKIIKNKGSLKAHEMSCEYNPDKIKHKHSPKAGKKKGSEPWNRGIKREFNDRWRLYSNEEVFVENSSLARHVVKKRLLDLNIIDYKCDICDQEPVWNNKPMPLILDHINGINNDNRLENLRFVCSNCDSQLDTYKSRNRRIASKVLKES